jgi:hypothetical protein
LIKSLIPSDFLNLTANILEYGKRKKKRIDL